MPFEIVPMGRFTTRTSAYTFGTQQEGFWNTTRHCGQRVAASPTIPLSLAGHSSPLFSVCHSTALMRMHALLRGCRNDQSTASRTLASDMSRGKSGAARADKESDGDRARTEGTHANAHVTAVPRYTQAASSTNRSIGGAYGKTDRQTNEQTYGNTHESMKGQVERCTSGRKDGRTKDCMES